MFRIGQILKSYCNGYFGRDFYGGTIEAIGWDWVVARSKGKYPVLAYFEGGIEAHLDTISKWNEYEDEEEDD